MFVIVSMVVELGAPKPILLSPCISICYQINSLLIPHKNNTDMRFGSDFMITRLIHLTI